MKIKDELKKYRDIVELLEMHRGRLEYLQPTAPGYAANKAKIEQEIKITAAAEQAQYNLIIDLVNALPKIIYRQIITMRYIDGHGWDLITASLFGKYGDFYERPEAYKRRIFRIHGRALQALEQLYSQAAGN